MVGWTAGLLLCGIYVVRGIGYGRGNDDQIVDTFRHDVPNIDAMEHGIKGIFKCLFLSTSFIFTT